MVAVPVPYDFTAATKATATAMDAGVRDVLLWWMGARPKVHAYDSTGAVSLADGADTLLTFNNELYDNDTMHSTTAPASSRITFTTAGVYDVKFQFQLPAATYTTSNVNMRLNSAENPAGGTSLGPFLPAPGRFLNLAFSTAFNAGDHIQAWINQTSGAARVCSAGPTRTFFSAIWVSN